MNRGINKMYVYLFKVEELGYKVGVTESIKWRPKEIAYQTRRPCEVVCALEFTTKRERECIRRLAYGIESRICIHFKPKCSFGKEWFDFDDRDVETIENVFQDISEKRYNASFGRIDHSIGTSFTSSRLKNHPAR